MSAHSVEEFLKRLTQRSPCSHDCHQPVTYYYLKYRSSNLMFKKIGRSQLLEEGSLCSVLKASLQDVKTDKAIIRGS